MLLHSIKGVSQKEYRLIKITLNYLKKKKLTKYVGISIYNQKEFDIFMKIIKPDIVQGQLNIFDDTMIRNDFLKKLKLKKIKFYARSIFLQGILLSNI